MTKSRLQAHIQQFKDMGILNPNFKAKSKKELVEGLDLALGMCEWCRDCSKNSDELEKFSRIVEDLRWARAQVL